MTQQHPIVSILDRWPNRKAIADDAGVDLYAVHRWYQRKSINGRHDAALISGARRRKIRLSAKELAEARSTHADQGGHIVLPVQGLDGEKATRAGAAQ